jgi:hypothetical protein
MKGKSMKDIEIQNIILEELYKKRNLQNENKGYIKTLEVIDYQGINLTEDNLYRIMENLKEEGKIEGSIKPTYSGIGVGLKHTTFTTEGTVKITNLGIKEIEKPFIDERNINIYSSNNVSINSQNIQQQINNNSISEDLLKQLINEIKSETNQENKENKLVKFAKEHGYSLAQIVLGIIGLN